MGQRTWAAILSAVVLLTIFSLNISKNNKDILLASNFSLYEQIKKIAPKSTQVEMLIPFGQDSHGFVPSPKSIAMIIESKHFFYVSKGMDKWIASSPYLQEKDNSTDLSSVINWIGSHHEHAGKETHDEYQFDPHYWFNIKNMLSTASEVHLKLLKLFPKKEAEINLNYKNYLVSLTELSLNYHKKLSSCDNKKLYVTHDAFAYLEDVYGFEVRSIVGLSPEATPSAHAVKEIIESLKVSKVKTIFFESFISNKMAKTIANELGIEVDVLETLATISAKQNNDGVSYKDLMQVNLEKISKALECH